MNYRHMIEQARANGITSDKKMWDAIGQISIDLAPIETVRPKVYWNIMRNQHAILYERHYSDKFAAHDVNNLAYTDNEGQKSEGAHWSRSEILNATAGMKFHPKVNDWDKYVAFNSMYADLCSEMNDAAIIKAAYLFYFCDKDWQPDEDDCTKIWDYMSHHATM